MFNGSKFQILEVSMTEKKNAFADLRLERLNDVKRMNEYGKWKYGNMAHEIGKFSTCMVLTIF